MNKIKIGCGFISAFIFFIRITNIYSLNISAKSAILICADSNEIIWSKNHTEPLSMASTTKIMTSLLALEEAEAQGERSLEITDEMIRVEGTSMGLSVGDLVNLETLVRGMLLPSGNDAANAAAILVCGNVDDFLKRMNDRAKEIGMEDTVFCTPSGLDRGNHHSTAKDMAILGAYAMKNKKFAEIARERNCKVKFGNSDKIIHLKNHNRLLRLYPYCIGIKTGFTEKSGRCLVSCAEKNNVRLVCVTLNDPDDWDDHISLYEYGFSRTKSLTFDDTNEYFSIEVNNGEKPYLNAQGSTSFSRIFQNSDYERIERKIKLSDEICAPVNYGQYVGKIEYYLDGKKIGENMILSTEEILEKPKKNIFQRILYSIINLFKYIWNSIRSIFK